MQRQLANHWKKLPKQTNKTYQEGDHKSEHWKQPPNQKKAYNSRRRNKGEPQRSDRRRTQLETTKRANVPYLADFGVLEDAAQLGAQYLVSYARFHQGLDVENHDFRPRRTTCNLPAQLMAAPLMAASLMTAPLLSENKGRSAMASGAR